MKDTWQRCFIALTPDVNTRQHLAGLPVHPKACRVDAADLHLTLAFLGALAPTQAQHLRDVLPQLAGPLPALVFSGLERWPDERRPRVEVATFVLPEELAVVVRRLHPWLTAMGLPVDSRPFRPHFTLARFRHGDGAVHPAAAAIQGFDARVETLSLYARSVQPTGPRYTLLAAAALNP